MSKDVFISYATPDVEVAKRVETLLRKSGIDAWFAIHDARGQWRTAIFEAIANGKVLLLLWSKNALASPEVQREIELAENHRRRIIPVRLDAAEFQGSSGYVLSGTHFIDASRGPIHLHSKQLVESVREALSQEDGEQGEVQTDAPETDSGLNGEYAISHVYRIESANSDLLHILHDCPSLQAARSPFRKAPPEEDGDLCAELMATRLRPCLSCLKLLRTYHEGPGTLISTVTWNNATLRMETARVTYEQKNAVTEIPWHAIDGVEGTPKDWLHANRVKILTKDGQAIELKLDEDPMFHAVGSVLAGLAGFRW